MSMFQSKRRMRWLVPLAVVPLALVACGNDSAQDSGASGSAPAATSPSGSAGANAGAVDQTASVRFSVQPDDQGRSLLDAIGRATTSVAITVYEIDAPQINQALVEAVERGVNVRLVLNGQWWGGSSTRYAYDVKSVLDAAAAKPGAGKVEVNWSSNNFQITHQKTVLVDALGKNGEVLAPADLPATAVAMVLTGNLNAYGYQSYQPQKCPAPCNFWSARDFYMAVTDSDLIAEIARVFASDFACDGRTVTNGLRDTPLALTWSNGSTGVQPGDAADEYPADGQYPYFSSNPATPSPDGPDPGPGTDQGNVRSRMLAVINGAQERLDVYNEEMNDQQTVDAIAAAAQRLGPGKVRVVMTGSVNGQNSYAKAYNQMQAAGATIHLFPSANNVLYIHAKAILADGKNAYVGSTNISSPSINFNRELGLVFADQPDVLAPVLATFETDFNNPVAVPWTQQTVSAAPPQAGASADQPNTPPPMEAPQGSNTIPMTCGPVTLPTPWPPTSPSGSPTAAPTTAAPTTAAPTTAAPTTAAPAAS